MMALPLSDTVLSRPDEIVTVHRFSGGVRVTWLSPWGSTSSSLYLAAEIPADVRAWSPAPAIRFKPFALDLRGVKPLGAVEDERLERRFLARAIHLRGYRVIAIPQRPHDYEIIRSRVLEFLANLGREGST